TLTSLFVFSLIGGLSFPVQKQLLNDAITANEHRATLLSVESILDRSVCALVAIAIGDFLARGALHQFLLWAAVSTAAVMVIVGFVVYFLQSKTGEAVYEKTHCP